MTQTLSLRAPAPALPAQTALRATARLWFVTAVIGQWAFLFYIAGFYGRSTLLELYMRADKSGGPSARLAVAGGLVVLTALTGVGIIGVYMGMWRPLLAGK